MSLKHHMLISVSCIIITTLSKLTTYTSCPWPHFQHCLALVWCLYGLDVIHVLLQYFYSWTILLFFYLTNILFLCLGAFVVVVSLFSWDISRGIYSLNSCVLRNACSIFFFNQRATGLCIIFFFFSHNYLPQNFLHAVPLFSII